MKILFTGASSFTGLWFVRELAQSGHEVVATFRRRPEDYPDPLRRERVSLALAHCRGVFGCSFGDPSFIELAGSERWDLYCHHAADVTKYRSPDFDPVAALGNNTRNIAAVVAALKATGGRPAVVVSGSVFENDEGAGSNGLPAFSPYGLSKSFTWQMFRYHVPRAGLPLGKFVIPNPFGPYEEPRFTAYLIKAWFERKAAMVSTPNYVRDNIHVSLLAKAYAKFVRELPNCTRLVVAHPSGYAESQGAFALRFAANMRPRLGLSCEVELPEQTLFTEPMIRINTDYIDALSVGWGEARAWDELANYYARTIES
jgi:nucleoside-diphosphate-sugar epimerase